ncbi:MULTISPECIES: type II toxin-antitoxin system RelE/ParE family toxin [Lachnospiraceae]|jgi:toxin ParE1/3/4|uniref:Type II toxin-antitoxin system RelE/ParE family toxin n=1 Tax=Faecalicatena acetigenes TaxID=2981790 RepID=A0ABT2TBD6_9FIRM|nr:MULTISPECIES: type II toxin-antitoxin system RelE/ParE family toxin [Lachnospiraceae]MCU6747560.1 type II toxin-antitoxin system RelE/ParE family toxin [Faecalicatena acetigenes]RGT75175.1 type II toxin-antitoxin system RelE/ParE family toxin [Ruminococcus sp. AF18-22]SCH95235.1 Plasmid stabilisation system protein [uncultured Clostridium sp.]
MIFDVKLSKQADSDLRNIYEYIAFELQAPENADGQLNQLEKMILSLEEMPERFRRYEKEPWRSQGLRIVPVDNYLVVYIPEIDIQRVTVIRVLYGRRNVDEELRLHTTITTE